MTSNQKSGAVYLLLLLLLFTACTMAACASDQDRLPQSDARPNIVLILADDIGVETVSAYGSEIQTPHLDALAAGGVLFANMHATPLCTPSRVRLLTGQYSFRNYKSFGYLDPESVTLATQLKQAGYATAVSGKWQLAGSELDQVPGASPVAAGFTESLAWQAHPGLDRCRYWSPELERNGVAEEHQGSYGPDLINDFALDFVTRHRQQPFFLYYPMLLAHDPFVPTPRSPPSALGTANFPPMMSYLDRMVGRLMDRLAELGLERNTLLVFVGDNGTHNTITTLQHGQPVTGGKATTLQTATHVPMLMRWPGRLPQGAVFEGMTDLVDVYATLLAAADLKEVDSDGFDLLPALTNKSSWPRQAIFMEFADDYWPFNPSVYAFNAQWKLYTDGRFFDLDADPAEQRPLAPNPGDNPAQTARSGLQQIIDTSGFLPLTLDDPFFPQGFDPESINYDALDQDRAKSLAYCSDPGRIPVKE